jgi:hypothetical protein
MDSARRTGRKGRTASRRARRKLSTESPGRLYRNDEIAELARSRYTLSQLHDLQRLLEQRGTHAIAVPYGTVTVAGEGRRMPFVAATETRAAHGDMSEKVYLRDHNQTAWAFMELYECDPGRHPSEGAMVAMP